MAKVPAEVRQLLRDIPVSWDESRFIDGEPGKYAVVARRRGTMWYVAGLNGEQQERRLSIPLDFVGNASASLLIASGGDSRSFEINHSTIRTEQPYTMTLKPNDGFLLTLKEY